MPDKVPVPAKILGGFSNDLGFVAGGPSTSQYDRNTPLGDLTNLNASRAARQPWYDELANMGVQIFSTVVGQSISAVGSISDGVHNLMAENDYAPDAGLSGVGQDLVNWGANEYPIYYDPEQGGIAKYGSYIASRIPSVASTLSMLLPGMAVSRLAGGTARLLRLGSNIEKIAAVGAGGIAMRHAENWMESGQVYSQVMEQYMNGLNLSGENEEGKMLASEEAKKVAGNAASLTYMSNWANLAFDLIQLSAVLKPVTGAFSKVMGGESKLGSVLDYGYNTTKARGLLEGAGKAQLGILRGISAVAPFAAQMTEGIEEVVNQISQYEGFRQADIAAGTMKDDGSSLMDRVKNDYLGRWETKDAFAWGLIGGVAFNMAGAAIANSRNQHGWWNNVTEQAERIASIKQRQETLADYTKVMEDEKSTKYDKEVARHNLVFNLVQNNRQSDTFDMLLEDLKNPKTLDALSKNMGATAEEFRSQLPQITADMKWINNTINDYEGGGWNKKTEGDTDTSIPIEEENRVDFLNKTRRIGNYADPRLSIQLAYNDYSMKVRDRINESALNDINENTKELFAGGNVSPNAQAFLSVESDITGLKTARAKFQRNLEEAQKMELSNGAIEENKKVLQRLDEIIADKEKDQEGILKSIKDNLASDVITNETTFERLEDLRNNLLPVSKIVSKKTTYFINQGEKEGLMENNRRILKDPKAFEIDAIEDMRKITDYHEGIKTEQEAVSKDQESAAAAAEDLLNTPEYADYYKAAADAVTGALDSRSEEEKQEYLAKELERIEQAKKAGVKDGTMDTSSTKGLQNLDKDAYMKMAAREQAVKEKVTVKKSAAKVEKNATTPTKTNKRSYKGFDKGTPPANYFEYKTDNKYFKELLTGTQGTTFPLLTIEQDIVSVKASMQKITDDLAKINDQSSETEKDVIVDNIYKSGAIDEIKTVVPDFETLDPNGKVVRAARKAADKEITMMMDMLETLNNVIIPQSQVYADNLDKPVAGNYIIKSNLPFNRNSVGTGFDGKEDSSLVVDPSRIFYQKFVEVAGSYPTMRAMLTDIQNVLSQLDQVELDLQAAADLYLEGKDFGPKPPAENIMSQPDQIEFALDTDKGVQSRRTENRGRSDMKLRVKAVGSNESYNQKVAPVLFETKDGKLTEKRDSLGRMMPNAGYPFWAAHALENGKPGKGFVKAGDTVILKAVNGTYGMDIQLYKDNIHIGNMDSSARMLKSLLSAQTQLENLSNKAENKAKRIELENAISRYQELIPLYRDIENQMSHVTGPMEIKVKDKVLEGDDMNSSGGVFFGDVFDTLVYDKMGKPWTNPISILDAFGDTVNQTDNAVMSIYYNGNFYVNQGGKMVDVTNKFSNIVIPESQRSLYMASTSKSHNSRIFALVPTNTLTRDGKHIYVPMQQFTRNLNDMRNSQDGKQGGPTMPEVMTDAMMNPDKNAAAFGELVKASRLTNLWDQAKPIALQSKKFLDSFYTTGNLLDIFNKVTYVYDGTKEYKDPTKGADYSNHIGLDVFYPKGSEMTDEELEKLDAKKARGEVLTEEEKRRGYPILRFDLSNDSGSKNTYAIRLFNEDGKFEPRFGKAKKMAGQLMAKNEREQVTAEGLPSAYQIVEVDVMNEIKKRFNQKIFRVNKERISDTVNNGSYSGFSFAAGQLVYKSYLSYIHYLSENQFVESTVHGMEVRSADRKITGRNYFYNRSIWFENDLKTPGKTTESKTAAPKKTKAAKKDKIAAMNSKAKESAPINAPLITAVPVPAAIKAAMDLQAAGKIEVKGDKYIINGQEYERVSAAIGSPYSKAVEKTMNTAAGDRLDSMSKDFFAGKLQSREAYGMNEESFNAISNYFNTIKSNFSNTERVVGTGVKIFYTFPDGRKIAGEIDLLTVDADGRLRIYDFKSSKDIFTTDKMNQVMKGNKISRTKKDQFHLQQSAYSRILQGMTGIEATSLNILPVTISSEVNEGEVNITTAMPYDPIVFRGEHAETDKYIPSLKEPVAEEEQQEELYVDEDDEVQAPVYEENVKKIESVINAVSDEDLSVVQEELNLATPKEAKTVLFEEVRNVIAGTKSSRSLSQKVKDIISKLLKSLFIFGVLVNMNFTLNAYTFKGNTAANFNQKTFEQYDHLTEAGKQAYASEVQNNKPFIIVDKPTATVYVFGKDGALISEMPAILGAGMGENINESDVNNDLPGTKATTPAGRFSLRPANSADYEGRVLVLDGQNGIAIHQTYAGEIVKRTNALNTPTAADNRMSWGCINVDKGNWDKFIKGNIGDKSIIIITPDIPPVKSNPKGAAALGLGLFGLSIRRRNGSIDIFKDNDNEIGIGRTGHDKSNMADVIAYDENTDEQVFSDKLKQIYKDPARMRAHGHTMAFQNAASELVGDALTKILYNRRIIDNNSTGITYKALKAGVKTELERLAKVRTQLIANKKYINASGIVVPLTDNEVKVYEEQHNELNQANDYLDYIDMTENSRKASQDFVGYMRLAIMQLNSSKLVNIQAINDNEDSNTGDDQDELNYSARFVENYSFKIDPKTTITVEAKILLSQMRELNRKVNADGSYSFDQVFNRFGTPKNYNLGGVLNELHMDFEEMAHERFIENMRMNEQKSPYVKSLFQTIDRLAKNDDNRREQFINMLSSLVKQHRQMLFSNVDLKSEKNKETVVTFGDAARQGITEQIISEWQNKFKENFNNLFEVKEVDKEQDQAEYDAAPKKQTVNFSKKSEAYNDFTLSLPEDWTKTTYPFTRMYRVLYDQLKAAVAKGNVNLKFTFNKDSNLVIGKNITSLTTADVFHIAALFDLDNITFDNSLRNEVNNNAAVFSDTKLAQVTNNLQFLLKRKGQIIGDENTAKSFTGYDPIVYQMMASQLQRIGVQLAEDPANSYLVLADLNSPQSDSGRYMKFQRYDKDKKDFASFLMDKIGVLTIDPLMTPGAFYISKDYVQGEGDSSVGTAKLSVEDPLARARRGLTPLALHARTEWVSYANEVIRNANGNLEYTYNPHNTLSIVMNKLKDPQTGFVEQLASTPFGKFNKFIQQIAVPDSPALSSFNMKYIDGGKIDKFKTFTPERMTLGIDGLIGWNAYMNGEARGSRTPGYYITTHGDSTVMPAFQFNKHTIVLNMDEYIKEDGTTDYMLRLQLEDSNGRTNPVYEEVYGIFRGELERIAQGYRIYNEIASIEDPQARKEYAYKNYMLDFHFKTKVVDGQTVISGPGNAVNFYFGGSKLFTNWKGTGLYNNDKSSLAFDLVDAEGEVIEDAARQSIDKIIQVWVNDITEDAYKGALEQEGDFFKIIRKTDRSLEGSKRSRVDIEFPYLNSKSVKYYRDQLFDKNALFSRDGQPITNLELQEYIEQPYTKTWINDENHIGEIVAAVEGEQPTEEKLQGLTEPEIEAYQRSFLAIKDAIRTNDLKQARKPYALLKYMIADRVINEFVFRSTLHQMTVDPAIVPKASNYVNFHYDFVKRNTSMLAPGDIGIFDRIKDPARVVGFKDHVLGNIYTEYSDTQFNELDASEQEFLNTFKNKLPGLMKEGRFPDRALEYSAFWHARPVDERNQLWSVIEEKLQDVKTTDAGSYITAREWLFRYNKAGKITNQEYQQAVNHFYYGDVMPEGLMSKLKVGVLKYVYAGPNVVEHDETSSDLMDYYIKNAELPLLAGITVAEGTPLDNIRRHLENIERREYQGYNDTEPHAGIIAVPPSALKLGFTSEANLYDVNGNATEEILNAPVIPMDRTFLRQQIQSSDQDRNRATVSIQSAKFKGLNVPGTWKFGRNGDLTFSTSQEKLDSMTESEAVELQDMEGEDATAANGLSNNQIEIATYRIYRELALNKIRELSQKMGFRFSEEGLDNSIRDIDKFIATITQHAMDQYGMSSNATSYLDTVPDENRMRFPITFSPNNTRFQSVILSELQKIFHRFTLPGGAYAQVSATGLQKDNTLKSYRVRTQVKTFADEAAMNRQLNREEIKSMKKNADGTITANYYVSDPGEAMMVWNFKDEAGKPLPYDKFLNQDGTVRTIDVNGKQVSAIDDELLTIIVNRIPNTGANTMSRLKVVRFFPKGVKDAIAMAPEIVDVYNADFDYDKLYTYVYNHEQNEHGQLVKQQSVLHYTQDGIADFIGSDSARRNYARKELLSANPEYAELSAEVDEEQKIIEADEDEAIDGNNSEIRNWGAVTASIQEGLPAKIDRMKTMEAAMLKDNDFQAKYDRGTIYSRQSRTQLENALLDTYHVMLGDFKMLRASTHFLNADWLHKQLERKLTLPVIDEEGNQKSQSKTLAQVFEENEYFNISSYWTNSKMRAANSEAGRMVGISANMQTSMYLAQRYGLSYNSEWGNWTDKKNNAEKFEQYSGMTDYELEDANIDKDKIFNPELNPGWKYSVLFSDNDGNIKREVNENYNSMEADNRPYVHNGKPMDAYAAFHKKDNIGQIYGYPQDGRFRYDRIYTIDNKGNRVNVSTPVQSVLQAFLDNKNNPVRGYMNMNSRTSNAFMDMIFKGYTDETPLLLMQESVKKYIDRINGQTQVSADEQTSYTAAQVKTIAEITGTEEQAIWDRYRKLNRKAGTQNIPYLLTKLIEESIAPGRSIQAVHLALSENQLLDMIPMQLGYMPKSEVYAVNQLKALRNFLLADQYGRGLFTVQQATSADSKGLANSFVGLDIQRNQFNGLFQAGSDKNFYSSAPTVAGVHRIMNQWARQVKKNAYGSSRETASWLPGTAAFTYSYGIKPAYDLLSSIDSSNAFYEFSTLFKTMQAEFGNIIGKNLKTLTPKEQTRITKKLNVNFVSFLYSNPDLYRDFFNSQEEFEFFKEYGRRALTLPDSSLPVNANYEMFDKIESLAKTLKNVADMETLDEVTRQKLPYRNEFEILNALQPIFNTTSKSPASVILPGSSRFQEGLGDKIHVSIAAMFDSNNPMLRAVAKKLVLYAYMTGGVTSPNSFLQHIPPYILSHYKVDQRLFTMLDGLTDYDTLTNGTRKLNRYAGSVVQTFGIQFMQHSRFEMVNNVNDKQLVLFPAEEGKKDSKPGYIAYNVELGRMVIQFNNESRPDSKRYLVKYNDRLFSKVGSGKSSTFQEVDNAGYSRYFRNEYDFNTTGTPAETLFYRNRAERSKGIIRGVTEINGSLNVTEEDEEQLEFLQYEQRLQTPFNKKLSMYINNSNTEVSTIMQDLRIMDNSTLPASIFTMMDSLAKASGNYVEFVDNPNSSVRMSYDHNYGNLMVNYSHRAYGTLDNYNSRLFADDFAHEVAHMATVRAIRNVIYNRESMLKNRPELVQAVDGMNKLMEVADKALRQNKKLGEANSNYLRYLDIVDAVDKGKQLSADDIKFTEEHNYFRAFHDTGKNNISKENQLLEFSAYVFSNEKLQNVLNKISFKDTKTNSTLWEKLKEILSDLLAFFGFNQDTNASDDVASIQKRFVPTRSIVKYEDGIGVGYKSDKAAVPQSVSDLEEYSALHVALKQVLEIRKHTVEMQADENFTQMINDGASKSRMTDVYSVNNIPGIDKMYEDVPNYDTSWPDEIKELYHQVTSDGAINCTI